MASARSKLAFLGVLATLVAALLFRLGAAADVSTDANRPGDEPEPPAGHVFSANVRGGASGSGPELGQADLGEPTSTPVEPSEPAEVLTPAAENQRIESIWESTGPARKDALDAQARDVADAVVAELRGVAAQAELTMFECRSAGCMLELTLTRAEYDAEERRLLGQQPHAAVAAWPGPRINPPLLDDGGRVKARILLLRMDGTDTVSF